MSEPTQTSPYFVSQRISLTRAEVVGALTAAVLAKAGELARFGDPAVRSLALDAKVHGNSAVDVVGVVATVEAQLDGKLVALLSGPEPQQGRPSVLPAPAAAPPGLSRLAEPLLA